MILLDDSSKLKTSCFCLFVATQNRGFRMINPSKQAILFDDDGVSIPEIGSLLILSSIELCKRADLKSLAAFAC